MNYAHLFEAGMLICFGFSWPLNVLKAYRARTTKGTSLAFIILIITGYVAGITAKIINHQFNYVLAVYFINLAIVMMNVLVYLRNKSLDRKNAGNNLSKVEQINIEELAAVKEEEMLNYSNSLDEIINKTEKSEEKSNGVILMGGTMDKSIPVGMLAKEFDFNFDLYNKSSENLSIINSEDYFTNEIAKINPEGIIFHIGEEDVSLFNNNPTAFDNYYLNLISTVRKENKNTRMALVSISNPEMDKTIAGMNAHIRAIADVEKLSFINLDKAKLWNPEATKASSDFAYSMGLRIRKPLRDVAEILYSYAYHNLEEKIAETLVG